MKIYSIAPDGNEAEDLEPARYFNLAIKQIEEIEEWLRTTNEPAQALLVHIDILIYLSKKYPEMAIRRIKKLNIPMIKNTFDDWYERVNLKIPKQFREGIKNSADSLFRELDEIS